MKSAFRKQGTRMLTATAFAAAAALAVTPVASAAPFDINFDCQGDSPVGKQEFTLKQATAVNAPAQVAPGGALDVVVDPEPNDIPGEVNGFEVKQVTDMKLMLPIPANSTYVDAEISGGSNLGPTPPKLTVDGNIATLSLAGPLQGGSKIELPTITVHLKAAQSGKIETKLKGSSYEDPGLTLNAVVATPIGDTDVPAACFPNPNPVLTTTTIG